MTYQVPDKPDNDGVILPDNITSGRLPLNIYQKIADLVHLVGGYVQKDGKNTAQKYNYVSEGKILSKVEPALHDCRLIGLPCFKVVSQEDKATANGAIWKLATVSCDLVIIDIDSLEKVTISAIGQGIDPNDKAVAKAQTQAFKYAWWKLLCLETGDDPEADTKADAAKFVPQTQVETPWVRMQQVWDMAKYPSTELYGYLCKRFNHQNVSEVTNSELELTTNEIVNHLRAQGFYM